LDLSSTAAVCEYKTSQAYSASEQTVTISRMAVNVFNWCCWAVVLAVIVDAQPTVDETMTCSASTFEEVANDMVKLIASNQQEKAREIKADIKDVKTLLELASGQTNDSRLEEIAEEIRDDVKDMKTLLESESGQTNDTRVEDFAKEIKDVVKQLLLAPRPIELDAGSPSKQALVSALVCEYLLCF